MDSLEQTTRIVAIEARQADLERRIATLEAEAARQVSWPSVPPTFPLPNPWPGYWVPSSCPVCGIHWEGAMGYVCSNPYCPSRVTCAPMTTVTFGAVADASTPQHLRGTSAEPLPSV